MADELDQEDGRHWTMDLEPGATVERLAASLAAEAEAVAAMAAGPVYIRRGGDDEPWREITAEDRRARGL